MASSQESISTETIGLEASPFRIKLGAAFPNFECETLEGRFMFHDFLARPPAWTVLFSYAGDFDPVAETMLTQCQGMLERFRSLGIKLVGLSRGSVSDHEAWSRDVFAAGTHGAAASEGSADSLGFTLVADQSGDVARLLGIQDPGAKAQGSSEAPTLANAVFVIGPNKTNRLCMLYPSTMGIDFREVARCVESLFLTQDFVLATPVDWQSGARVVVAPGLSSEVAQERFNNFEVKALPSGKPYLRLVDCPAPGPPSGPEAADAPDTSHITSPTDFRIKLGVEFPDFHCCTTKGDFSFHAFLDREPRWTVLFSHPKDFTPVCTTELGRCQELNASFEQRGVKLIGLSCDGVDLHREWSKDVLSNKGLPGKELDFPLIADDDRSIAMSLGMLDPLEKDDAGAPMPARALFVIDPERQNRFTVVYPATTGRNFDEIFRALDAVFLCGATGMSTPAA